MVINDFNLRQEQKILFPNFYINFEVNNCKWVRSLRKNSMSTNQSLKLNFLSTTERRFYKKKRPSHDNSLTNNNSTDSRLFSVIRGGLNTSSSLRKLNHFQFLKTQQSQQRHSENLSKTYNSQFLQQPQFIKKQLKSKLTLLFKKVNKKWKTLLDSYEMLKKSLSPETFNTQQNKFLAAMVDLVKENIQEVDRLEKLQKMVKKPQNSQSKREQKELKINLQKIKLMKQNEILRKKCLQAYNIGGYKTTQLDNRNNLRRQTMTTQSQQISQKSIFQKDKKITEQLLTSDSLIKLKSQIKQLNQKIYDLEGENLTLKEKLTSIEDGMVIIKEDNEGLNEKVAELKSQNENFCAELVRVNLEGEEVMLKMERERAIIAFQREEILSYQGELNSAKNQYKDLMRKYKAITKKSNQNPSTTNQLTTTQPISTSNVLSLPSGTSSSMRQQQQLTPKYNEAFKQQLQSFQKIRTIFFQKQSQNTTDKSNVGERKGSGNNEGYKKYLSQKESITNPSGLKKLSRDYYSYFKPNFFAFVEGYMDFNGIDLTNMQQISATFQLDSDFLATIRAIMDSKFNDFLDENFSKTSSMPNFTYTWLTKYRIQRKQKKIVCIDRDLQKSVIPRFFMNLMSERLNSSWEIITFREFLMQSLTIDELYFYLMCRNYLFQGGLMDNISALYQQICYISIIDAQNLMQRFVPDIGFRKRMQEYIKKYVIYERSIPVVDGHFLLRILLEYYQTKKHQEFANLNSLSELLARNNKQLSTGLSTGMFSFEAFMKIFDYNFLYLSMTEKLEVFRKAFSCSRGNITLEVIFTVLTQEGYLCRDVKRIYCNDQILPKKQQSTKEDGQIAQFQSSLPQLGNFQRFFQRFYRQSFRPNRAQFGLYEIERKFNSVREFDQTTIFSRIQCVFNFCLSTVRKMFFTKKISLSSFLPILQQITNMLCRLSKVTCGKKQILMLMSQFSRQNAARRILRFYRKKRNQMHRNFILGIKDDHLQQDEKIANLRNEFHSMIENLKDKFPQKKQARKQQLAQGYEEI